MLAVFNYEVAKDQNYHINCKVSLKTALLHDMFSLKAPYSIPAKRIGQEASASASGAASDSRWRLVLRYCEPRSYFTIVAVLACVGSGFFPAELRRSAVCYQDIRNIRA